MKVKELMTSGELKYCSPDTKIASAAKIMKESNRGALPVLDKDKKVVGLITDRDLCLTLANGKPISKLSVKEILPDTKLHTVKPEDDVKTVLQTMRTNKIGRLPVTDESGKLKGMISVNNLLTRAVTKNEPIGQLKTKDESLAKTIKVLFDRNNNGRQNTAK